MMKGERGTFVAYKVINGERKMPNLNGYSVQNMCNISYPLMSQLWTSNFDLDQQ